MRNKAAKIVLLTLLVVMLMGITQVAMAAQTVDLAFDNIKLPVRSEGYGGTVYYTDTAAEVKNGRTFVPVRVVSELLGATVNWQGANVTLQQGEASVKLTVGSTRVQNGQQSSKLEAAPYIKADRIMVPIRFVAESFNCQVDYSQGLVNIHSNPFQLQNVGVVSIAKQIKMTSEINTYEIQSPLFAQKMYMSVATGHGAEVAQPEYYGKNNIADYPNFYWQKAAYYLLDTNDRAIKSFEVYEVAHNGFGEALPAGYTNYLLYMDDSWYALSDEAFNLMQAWGDIAQWEYTGYKELS